MILGILTALIIAGPLLAANDPITAENIEAGRLGIINRLTVIEAFGDTNLIVAQFDGIKVLINGFPSNGIGKGKILPKSQVWRVGEILTTDTTGHGLAGCYVIRPADLKAAKKEEPKKKRKK